jgi:hypothetical protein
MRRGNHPLRGRSQDCDGGGRVTVSRLAGLGGLPVSLHAALVCLASQCQRNALARLLAYSVSMQGNTVTNCNCKLLYDFAFAF